MKTQKIRNRMKNIDCLIIIIYSDLLLSGGGRETWLNQFVNNKLIKNRFSQIDIVSASSSEIHGDKIKFSEKVKVHTIDVKKYTSLIRLFKFILHSRKVVSSLRSTRQDNALIISVGSFNENISAILSKSRSDIVYSWLRGIWEKEISHRHSKMMTTLIVLVECFFLKRSSMVIANGLDTHNFYKTKGVHSFVVNNGIDLTRFSAVSPSNEVRLGFVGRLSKEKGIQSLLAAMRMLKFNSNVDLSIIGQGPELPSVLKFVDELAPKAKYLGSISNSLVPKAMNCIDISFHLTGAKVLGGGGVSHGLLEAMASGHRIICWDNPIFRQIEGSEGFYFVEEGNLSDLVQKTETAINDCLSGESSKLEIIRKNLHLYTFDNHVKNFLHLV